MGSYSENMSQSQLYFVSIVLDPSALSLVLWLVGAVEFAQ